MAADWPPAPVLLDGQLAQARLQSPVGKSSGRAGPAGRPGQSPHQPLLLSVGTPTSTRFLHNGREDGVGAVSHVAAVWVRAGG